MQKNNQHVWRWYYVDKDGNWVGPYRNRKDVAGCARSSMRGEDDVVEIAMWKTSTLDLSGPIDDAFAEEMLLSLMMDADVYGKYETRFEIEAEIAGFCTDAKRHDLVRRLKATVKAWQKDKNIIVPCDDLIESKNNYFVHPNRKKASKAEEAAE